MKSLLLLINYLLIYSYLTFILFRILAYYFLLPETENISLEDIETHFSDNKKKITEISIKKTAPKRCQTIETIEMASKRNNDKTINSYDNTGFDNSN